MISNELAVQQLVDDRIASLRSTASRRRLALPRRTGALRWWLARRAGAPEPASRVAVGRPPTPFSDEFAQWANAVGAHVAEHGLDAVERPIAALVRQARRHQVSATVVDVLADRDAPSVARERALGAVLVALAGSIQLDVSLGTTAA